VNNYNVVADSSNAIQCLIKVMLCKKWMSRPSERSFMTDTILLFHIILYCQYIGSSTFFLMKQ